MLRGENKSNSPLNGQWIWMLLKLSHIFRRNKKQEAQQNTVVAHTGASCCLQSHTKTDITKSTEFYLHVMHSTKVICWLMHLFPGWAQSLCDFCKGSGHPERRVILSTSGRTLEETWNQKTTTQVSIHRTPDVTDTDSKLRKLPSSLGTKIATFLINSIILFYSTLSSLSLCVNPLFIAQTQDCFVHTTELQKRRKEREAFSHL